MPDDAPKPKPEPTSYEWKWYDERCRKDIVVPKQQPIAIYQNVNGDIIIRQQDEMDDEEREGFIWIQPKNLEAVINKLVEIHRVIDE